MSFEKELLESGCSAKTIRAVKELEADVERETEASEYYRKLFKDWHSRATIAEQQLDAVRLENKFLKEQVAELTRRTGYHDVDAFYKDEALNGEGK